MKPLYLEFCGINSFSEKAQIDFKALLSGGVFGIFGDTGSGKSTILDSIHFALYGEIDRVPKSFNDCINYRLDGAYVIFDFELTAEGTRRAYRVRRERKRKNGTTKAYLYEYGAQGELLALAEGARDVDERLKSIIGLTFEDFKMCIALPQGDFAALVKSTPAERVKLVARLFNLDRYGERLTKAVNEKYYSAEAEVKLVQAKMGENEGGGEENIAKVQAQIEEEKQRLKAAQTLLAEKETALTKALELEKAKIEYDKLCQRLQYLGARFADMEEKRKLLAQYPKAKSVCEKAALLEKAQTSQKQAMQDLERVKQEKTVAEQAFKNAETALNAGGFEEKILKISLDLQKVNDAKEELARAEKTKQELSACRKRYAELAKACEKEDFEGEKARLEAEISALGEDENLLDYLKRHYKNVLLVDTYGEIRLDLKTLSDNHPSAKADVEKLLQKYTLPNDKNATADVAAVHLEFKAQEQKRKTLKQQLQDLEKRRIAFEKNEMQKETVRQQGVVLSKACELAEQNLLSVKSLGSAETLTAGLNKTRTAQAQAQRTLEAARKRINDCTAEEKAKTELCVMRAQARADAENALKESLREHGYTAVEQAERASRAVGDFERTAKECESFFEEYALVKNRFESTDREKLFYYDPETLVRAKEEKRLAGETLNELHRSLGAKEKELSGLIALREKYKELKKELAEKEKRMETCDELRLLLRGNRFLEFIACEYLQEICASASKTLLSLTGGRYFLQYDKDFKVGDNLDGGSLRAVRTLSGGETFLVSLSLALSLSGALCLKSLRPIEFFFLDEGFGTLDEKLVDTVMDVLGKLSKNFAVGLISHVEELKRRIEYKVVVTGASESKGSTLRVETF